MGACRLCIVEVSGSGRLVPACTTPVQEGMSVMTNSPKLTRYRRMIVELLLVGAQSRLRGVRLQRPLRTAIAWRRSLGITNVRFRYRYPKLPVDLSQERYVLDHNRCILCTRCVRVCAEVEGAHVWDVIGARDSLAR